MAKKKSEKNPSLEPSGVDSSAGDDRVVGGARTRAKSKKTAELLYYSTLTAPEKSEGGPSVRVISKKGRVIAEPGTYDKIQAKFAKIEHERLGKESGAGSVSAASMSTATATDQRQRRTILLVTHVNTFLYATCFWIQVGTLPYLSKSLGADPATFGQLQTSFAVLQLLGGPLYGRLGDVAGERATLTLAFASAAAGYAIMAGSYSLPMLFVSRIPSIFMHTMQGSQMIVTSFSSESERASGLARLGFSYGIGMVAGPTLGGFIGKFFGEQSAAMFAAAGSLLSLALVRAFIPRVTKPKSSESSSLGMFNVGKILSLLFLPGAGMLLVFKTVAGIPIGVLQSMFSVIAMERFNLPTEKNGLMLSYIGVISIVMQGVGISVATSRFSDKTLVLASTLVLTVAYYALSLITDVVSFVVLLLPLTCALTLVSSILTAALTKTVSSADTGAMLGLNMAVHSTIRTLAPTVGGYLVGAYGFESLGYLGVACNILAMLIVGRTQLKEHVS